MRAVCVLALLLVAAPAAAQEIGWSPGLLYTVNRLGDVETTDLIDHNGIVQTTSITTSQVRPAIEVHAIAGGDKVKIGPFVGAELGEHIISAVGAGVVIEVFGMPIGIGYWVKPEGLIRREDFIPGQPAPPGFDEVQYVRKAVTSLAIMAGIPLP